MVVWTVLLEKGDVTKGAKLSPKKVSAIKISCKSCIHLKFMEISKYNEIWKCFCNSVFVY